MKIAIIGCGKMGLLHASILSFLPDVEVVALCDKSFLLRRYFKKIFEPAGIKVLGNLEDLATFDLDAAYVTTPISSHSSITKELYNSKIVRNIFVEKTLASNLGEAKELCKVAQDCGGTNMVGYMKRFAVTFGKARDILSEGDLGEISAFEAYAYSSDFVGLNENLRKAAPRGGALRDLGCHVIDLALWLLGDFKVESVTNRLEAAETPTELVSFHVANSNGVGGRFSISRAMTNYRMPEMGLTINGSKGIITVNDDKLGLRLNNGELSSWYRHDLGDNVDFCLGESEYFRENQHFVDSALRGSEAKPNFHTASKVNDIIDQIRQMEDEI